MFIILAWSIKLKETLYIIFKELFHKLKPKRKKYVYIAYDAIDTIIIKKAFTSSLKS